MVQDSLEKLTLIYLVDKFPSFMEPIGSLQCSQNPVTGSNAERIESNP